MTRYLVDANVLFAFLNDEHEHHMIAKNWWTQQERARVVHICRTVHMAALRLSTSRSVMESRVLSPSEFWAGWDTLLEDDSVLLIAEPPGTERAWREICAAIAIGTRADTDTYLAAVAIAGGYTFATLDQGFSRFPTLTVEILS